MTIESYSLLSVAIKEIFEKHNIKVVVLEYVNLCCESALEAVMWLAYNMAVDCGLLNNNNFDVVNNEEVIWRALKSISKELDLKWMSQS